MEVKINPRFEKFSPLKKQEEIDALKESLLKKGYVGSRILTWHSYIVDGHNRYRVCKELGIKLTANNFEEIDLGDNADEIDAMDWMLTHQLSSKNLTPSERIAMTQEFEEEVRKDNEKKKLSNLKQNQEADRSLQLEATDQPRDRSLNTDRQIAKKANVGVGTVARYNKIMKSDDNSVKEKVKSGEITINKGYEEIRKKEKRICKSCGIEKNAVDFFGNDTVCKTCSKKSAEDHMHDISYTSTVSPELKKNIENSLKSEKEEKMIDQEFEVKWFKDTCSDFVNNINERYFSGKNIFEKVDKEHIRKIYDVYESFVSNVFDIQKTISDILEQK